MKTKNGMTSNVMMEQKICLVTGKPYDTGTILLRKQLLKNESNDKYCSTGFGLSPEVQKMIDDGFVATTPQEFVDKIKAQVAKSLAEGNKYEWTTDYAFALALTDDEDDATSIDSGDWVNAQFTSKNTNPESEIDSEIIYEYYHIVDGKVMSWSQFKKTIKR